MFLATGPDRILEGPNFFKNEYLSKFSAAKMKKTLVIMSQKYYIDYEIVKRKNRKLRPNILLQLRAAFSSIRVGNHRNPGLPCRRS